MQQVHPSSVHRFTDVEPGHFLEPGLSGHHLTLPPQQVRVPKSQLGYCYTPDNEKKVKKEQYDYKDALVNMVKTQIFMRLNKANVLHKFT